MQSDSFFEGRETLILPQLQLTLLWAPSEMYIFFLAKTKKNSPLASSFWSPPPLQLPPLFDGCFFFLHGSFQQPSRAELARLLRDGGGRLLSRQPKPDSDVTQTLNAAAYHAEPGSDQALCTQYIVFDGRGGAHRPAGAGAGVRRGKVWWAPSSWLIDCIAAFRLLPVPDPQNAG